MNLPTEVKAAIDKLIKKAHPNANGGVLEVFQGHLYMGAEIYAEHLASGDLVEALKAVVASNIIGYVPTAQIIHATASACAAIAQSRIDAALKDTADWKQEFDTAEEQRALLSDSLFIEVSRRDAIIQKYEKIVSNIQWHIKTNLEPGSKEALNAEENMRPYLEFLSDMKPNYQSNTGPDGQ